MSLLIDNPAIEQAVKALSDATGETADRTVELAVKERLDRVTRRKGREMLERITPVLDKVALMPELDSRSPDEIIGYNEQGIFS